jgi:hypothetical protein
MFHSVVHRSAILVLGAAAFLFAASERTLAERIVREQRTMAINGATEVWQLIWEGKPATA